MFSPWFPRVLLRRERSLMEFQHISILGNWLPLWDLQVYTHAHVYVWEYLVSVYTLYALNMDIDYMMHHMCMPLCLLSVTLFNRGEMTLPLPICLKIRPVPLSCLGSLVVKHSPGERSVVGSNPTWGSFFLWKESLRCSCFPCLALYLGLIDHACSWLLQCIRSTLYAICMHVYVCSDHTHNTKWDHIINIHV